jgi:hypothetical protein
MPALVKFSVCRKRRVLVSLEKKPQDALDREHLAIFDAYLKSPYLSIKHTSYFHVYERLLKPLVGRHITFVEVGVYNGGSLFMWREFLGPNARIIGIDLNPLAKRWESEGFEIFIGNQADPAFWKDFAARVGEVDVLLDDGGHSNLQQIQTVVSMAPFIKDGGLLLVEDTHASYMMQFGNPGRHSFMRFAFDVVDSINGRFPTIKSSHNSLAQHVSSVSFFESIVAFHINRADCFVSQPTSNGGTTLDATDYRHHETRGRSIGLLRDRLARGYSGLAPESFAARVGARLFWLLLFVQSRVANRRAGKLFGR